jgi:hypothetical protein
LDRLGPRGEQGTTLRTYFYIACGKSANNFFHPPRKDAQQRGATWRKSLKIKPKKQLAFLASGLADNFDPTV